MIRELRIDGKPTVRLLHAQCECAGNVLTSRRQLPVGEMVNVVVQVSVALNSAGSGNGEDVDDKKVAKDDDSVLVLDDEAAQDVEVS